MRKSMARGTIRHFREDGRLYVYLDVFERSSKTVQDEEQADTSKMVQDPGQDRYVAALEDQIQFLRRELERKDAILLRLTERIPELEASPVAPQAPETPPNVPEGTSPRPDTVGAQTVTREPEGLDKQTEQTARRPWWLRWMGG